MAATRKRTVVVTWRSKPGAAIDSSHVQSVRAAVGEPPPALLYSLSPSPTPPLLPPHPRPLPLPFALGRAAVRAPARSVRKFAGLKRPSHTPTPRHASTVTT